MARLASLEFCPWTLCGRSLTSQDVVLVVVVSLSANFNETRQPFGGHELWNQVFIILQMRTQQSRIRS